MVTTVIIFLLPLIIILSNTVIVILVVLVRTRGFIKVQRFIGLQFMKTASSCPYILVVLP